MGLVASLLNEKSQLFHVFQAECHKALAHYRGWGWQLKFRILYLKGIVEIFYKPNEVCACVSSVKS